MKNKKNHLFVSLIAILIFTTCFFAKIETGFVTKKIYAKEVETFSSQENSLSNSFDKNTANNDLFDERVKKIGPIMQFYGDGAVVVDTDSAKINLNIQTTDLDAKNSFQQNQTIIDNIILFLTQNGVKQKDIKCESFYTNKDFDYSDNKKFLGFQTTSNYEVLVENIGQVNNLLSGIVENGATICNVDYFCKNYDEHYKSALKLAIENATNKAREIFGAEPKVLEIVEQNYSFCLYAKEIQTENDSLQNENNSVTTQKISARILIKFANNWNFFTTKTVNYKKNMICKTIWHNKKTI